MSSSPSFLQMTPPFRHRTSHPAPRMAPRGVSRGKDVVSEVFLPIPFAGTTKKLTTSPGENLPYSYTSVFTRHAGIASQSAWCQSVPPTCKSLYDTFARRMPPHASPPHPPLCREKGAVTASPIWSLPRNERKGGGASPAQRGLQKSCGLRAIGVEWLTVRGLLAGAF